MIAVLDKAVICYGKKDGQTFSIEKYPHLIDSAENAWFVLPLNGTSQTGSVEGNHLAFVYFVLLGHLNESFLEPPDLHPYLETMLAGKGSACKKIV